MSRSSYLSFFLLTVSMSSLIFVGAMCTREPSMKVSPVTLEYWHVFDDEGALQTLAAEFKARYPYVSINFRRFSQAEYERELVNALAAGRGPDLFSLPDTWIGAHEDKTLALPPVLTLPTFTKEGGFGGQTVAHAGQVKAMTAGQMRDLFVDVVADTVIRPTGSGAQGTIVGLPLALDTMVLYVNRDLLSRAGIAEPPATWLELLGTGSGDGMIAKLAHYNDRRIVTQSAIALGGADNIDRAPDILALLMLQNGTPMTDEGGTPTFNARSRDDARESLPGVGALTFYTDFASPTSENAYTWSDALPEALTAFTSGRSAMFLGYAYHLPLIRARAPRMNLTWRSVPQIARDTARVDYANFWVTTVSKQTKAPNEAWGFILFATTRTFETATMNPPLVYAKTARRPVALRSLIDIQRADDAEMRVFTDATLTAKNWYRGKEPKQMEEAMRTMIRSVVDGTRSAQEAVNFALQQLR